MRRSRGAGFVRTRALPPKMATKGNRATAELDLVSFWNDASRLEPSADFDNYFVLKLPNSNFYPVFLVARG